MALFIIDSLEVVDVDHQHTTALQLLLMLVQPVSIQVACHSIGFGLHCQVRIQELALPRMKIGAVQARARMPQHFQGQLWRFQCPSQ